MTPQTIFWEDISPLLLFTSSRTGHQHRTCCLVTSLLCLLASISCWLHPSFRPDFCLTLSPHIFLNPPLAVKMCIFSIHTAGLNKILGEHTSLHWNTFIHCSEESPGLEADVSVLVPLLPPAGCVTLCKSAPTSGPLTPKIKGLVYSRVSRPTEAAGTQGDCSLLWGGPVHSRAPGPCPSEVRNICKLRHPNMMSPNVPWGYNHPCVWDWSKTFTPLPVLKAFDIN